MAQSAPSPAVPGPVLRGTPVAPGVAMGPARRPAHELTQVPMRRVPRDQVERELNRFHAALARSEAQLKTLRERLRGRVPVDDARILDTHVAYLKDSVFLSDVENLVLGEQFALESAIAKVILDFDRIFRLVRNEVLRERAVDLRDVGIRVLQNLESEETQTRAVDERSPSEYVLVAHELSIVDMFGLEGEPVIGIVTEAGSLTSHAAILARSMRVPTLTGVEGLLAKVRDGEALLVDASEGIVRVRPEPLVLEQFRAARVEHAESAPVPAPRTAEGVSVELAATCGNLADIETAVTSGVSTVGLYRTELLFLVDREPPSSDALTAHYRAVLERAGEAPVTFRLLDLDSSMGVGFLHDAREANPQLGLVGVRALLEHEPLLRLQISSILRACDACRARARFVVPKIVDCGELRRVKEVLFEERYALRKQTGKEAPEALVGVVVETPAAALGIRDLAREADLVTVGLDSLQQYVLSSDRGHPDLGRAFQRLHPVLVRLLADVVTVCGEEDVPPVVFGVTAALESNLALLLGLGVRRFSLAPVTFREFVTALGRTDLERARRVAHLASRTSTVDEMDPVLEGYGHVL